jgi:ankyrin repeat protein
VKNWRPYLFTRYLRYTLYLIVFIGFNLGHAGSYDDYFQAIRTDDEATVQALLQRGFDVNTINPAGEHGLLMALRGPSLKVARVLLAWPKLQAESRSSADESPLMLAALHGLLPECEQLIALGADVNKPGWAPLHYAATRGHVAVMTLLLDHYAYIDAASPNGTTPLMMAAHYGTPSAVKLLLEADADPTLKNQLGLTAMDFAHRVNQLDSAAILSAFIRGRQPKGVW